MSFYLYLPSNSSSSYFPNNKIGKFRTKLSKRILLSSDYEVALTELSYFSSIKLFSSSNPTEREFSISYKSENSLRGQVENADISVDDVNYSSISDLVTCIEGLLISYTPHISIWIDRIKNRTIINISEPASLVLSPKLSEILGFTQRGFFTVGQHMSTNAPETSSGNYLYIYTDIIKNQIVGDTSAPLLRIVDNTKESREMRTVSFRPYYKEVGKREFDEIEVTICNELGNDIEFYEGPCTLTLHFQQKSSRMNNFH
jgi:hypothetical protein